MEECQQKRNDASASTNHAGRQECADNGITNRSAGFKSSINEHVTQVNPSSKNAYRPCFTVSPAVPGQVRHPSIVPEFLRSTRCGMTSARGHGAIVYCLNSGSGDSQTGRHNGLKMLCEGDTKNRWRDGQVCPDVRQGTMAPWARRLGCALACYAQIGRERSRETFGRREKGRKRRTKRVGREQTEGEGRGDGKGEGKRVGERESGARLVWRRDLSPGLEWKDGERRWR
ncbi:hypothetical protein TNCV_375351 [Trichonephila clavipes]|nr:hypothetical protein TNCV_375351 [Trichonephila clavipes]